jgi:hypothetical protein
MLQILYFGLPSAYCGPRRVRGGGDDLAVVVHTRPNAVSGFASLRQPWPSSSGRAAPPARTVKDGIPSGEKRRRLKLVLPLALDGNSTWEMAEGMTCVSSVYD